MSRLTYNPFTGTFDQVRVTDIDVDSDGVIDNAVLSVVNEQLDSNGVITLAIDSDAKAMIDSDLTLSGKIYLAIDSAVDSAALHNDGGYEFSGGFTDRTTGQAGVTDLGADVQYTTAMSDSSVFMRFGFDSAAQDSNDNPYWTSPTPADATGVGLFGGKYMPAGVSSMFDFNFNSGALYSDSGTYNGIKVTSAGGSYDFSQCKAGDLALVRFDFNITPQEANCTLEVGLIWQTRDSNDNPTFTFFLAGDPQFYGTGAVGKTFLSRPLISAYFASDEDVNARALPAIRCDRQILIQPLTTLVTIVR